MSAAKQELTIIYKKKKKVEIKKHLNEAQKKLDM